MEIVMNSVPSHIYSYMYLYSYATNRHHNKDTCQSSYTPIPWPWGDVPWAGSLPTFQAVHFPSTVLCCIFLQPSTYCFHCSVASGWVAYGILKQRQCMSLVTWEKLWLSVLQVTSTCRAKVIYLVWDCYNCAAENMSHLDCDIMSSSMMFLTSPGHYNASKLQAILAWSHSATSQRNRFLKHTLALCHMWCLWSIKISQSLAFCDRHSAVW
jgi:hypothetical protein